MADVTAECELTSITAPTATDNCGATITGTTTDPLTYNTQGTHVINWSFDDGNGNVTTETQNVVINDVTAPVADVATLADVTAECEVTSITAPTATDNCGGAITGTTTTTFPITAQGTTVVTWTYDDGNGNMITQTQNVIIDDVTAPVADVATLADVTAECEVTSITAPTATDNCGGAITGTTTTTFPITDQDTTIVTWTYDDGNGNISTQTQKFIKYPITNSLTTNICAGDSLFAEGVFQTTNGVYVDTLISASGCDSILTTTLIVNAIPTVDAGFDITICEGESVTLNTGTSCSNALDFDGSDDYVDLGNIPVNFANDDFTLEIWVKTTGSAQGILVKNDGNNAWEVGEKAFYITSGGIPAFVGWGNDYITGSTAVNDGNWHHLAVVWDYSGSSNMGVGKIYVDGQDNTSSYSYRANNTDNLGNTLKLGYPNFYSGEAPNYFSGQSYDLRIWNVAKTDQEISDDMNNCLTGNEAGLVAHYKFNENSGVILSDNTNNGNDGTLTNMDETTDWILSGSSNNTSIAWDNNISNGIPFTPNNTTTYTVTETDANGCVGTDAVNVIVNALPNVDAGADLAVCDGDTITLNGSGAASYVWNNNIIDSSSFIPSATTSGSSLSFDGNDDYLDLGNLGNHWNSTFEMWFKPSQDINGSLSQEQYLFSKDGDFLWTYRIGILTDGRIGLGINGTDNNGQWVYTNNNTWSSNNWYHIAVSIEDDGAQTGTFLKIYINGQLENTVMAGLPVQSNSYPTFVGTGVYGNDRWFNGNMIY